MIHHRPQAFDNSVFRRSYLISSSAVGSSMMLSLNLPLEEGNAGGHEKSAPNVFIRIDNAGRVVLVMPRLEMAQGASVRRLIAEELEVAPNEIDLEYAPPKDGSSPNTILQVLPTGHSNGICGTLTLLRKASATARVMLIAAAAGRWGVDARSCHACEGEVVHAPTWRKIKYGKLALDAVYVPIPKEITLKGPLAEGTRI
jgi:isoquinoline 1-oxidoreductase subunit beta